MVEPADEDDSSEVIQNQVDISEIASDLVTGVSLPAPIKRNLYKAFSRLCSAAIELPLAHLESKVNERRAETQARVRLINATAGQISEQLRIDPEYARRAASQFGNKIVREQVNLDMITAQGIEDIKQKGDIVNEKVPQDDIDDDWLNNFDAEARKKSTPEMQRYFARILSGEIKRPNSFSIKSVKILGEMDKKSAEAFQNLCSMCIVLQEPRGAIIDARVLSLGRNAADNALEKYGLGFGQLNFLSEHGLIISDYHSWRDYQFCIGQTLEASPSSRRVIQIPFSYMGKSWILKANPQRSDTTQFRLHGVALTRSGIELMRVVEVEAVETYTQELREFFGRQQLTMTETSDAIVITK